MRVFLAGIIQGSLQQTNIHNQDWREELRRIILQHHPQAEIYCHYQQHPRSITYDLPDILSTLEDGNRRAAQADVLLCYLPEASMGTAVEMYVAYKAGAVVLTITPMSSNWIVRAYSDRVFPDLQAFEQFLAGNGLESLLQSKSSQHSGPTHETSAGTD